MAEQKNQNNEQMISLTQMEQIVQQIFKQINANTQAKTTRTGTAELREAEKLNIITTPHGVNSSPLQLNLEEGLVTLQSPLRFQQILYTHNGNKWILLFFHGLSLTLFQI